LSISLLLECVFGKLVLWGGVVNHVWDVWRRMEGIRELICNYQLTDFLRLIDWSLAFGERLVLCFYNCISHGVEYCEVMV
jgi:hypothetical protein